MAKYLIQVGYTPDAWAAMVKKPQNRLDAVRPVVENLGGKFEDAWLSFGDYDIIGIVDMPDNIGAAAFSMAVASGGAVRAFRTTPLLSVDEGVEAMRRAQKARYQAPMRATARKTS
ncbi:MAG TPA: GYD domain-containing protein [Acidimicrobiales bacterium]|nr:GYD domain-containing protein [Acidimicrobiales bacterium]